MPKLRIEPDLDLHYEVDDFTDPWSRPEAVLLLHGNAESGDVWYGWMPTLARHLKVVRPDMRGFGASTAMPRDYPWALDGLVGDFIALMDELRMPAFHLVGAKLGGTVARRFAASFPERVKTLTVVGTPPPFRPHAAGRIPEWTKEFETLGVEHWARRSMGGRLGSGFPPEGVEWWTKHMGVTAASTQIGFLATIPCTDITADLPRIVCPTLVVTTEGSGLGSVEDTRRWQAMIPHSELLVLPGDSYHVAASDPERCARATLEFIRRHPSGT